MSIQIQTILKLVLVASLVSIPAVAQAQTDAEAPAVESYDYEFGYKEMWGRSDHKVGDYASVEHLARHSNSRGTVRYRYEADRKLRIKIKTSAGATLKFEGKMFENGRIKDESGLIDEALEGLFDTQFGVTHTYSRSAKGTLSTSLAPETVWQIEMEREFMPKGPDGPVADLTHGDRRIQFLWQSDDASGASIVDAYEDGLWLSSGAVRCYSFRMDLDPELKLVLLGAMETIKVAAKYHDTLHGL